MNLIKCPECAQTVSDQASACPHCGYGIARKPVVEVSASRSNETSSDTFLDYIKQRDQKIVDQQNASMAIRVVIVICLIIFCIIAFAMASPH